MGQPMHYGHAAHTMRGPGQKKSMMPFIVLGAGAIAGVIIAIVIATSGGGGGHGSAKAVVEGALAAASAGDADKLASFGVGSIYDKFVKCDAEKADETAADLAAHDKKRAAKMVESAKGMKLKLVEMPDIDKLGSDQITTIAKGTKIKKGCESTADARAVELKATISVQDGDKPAAQQKLGVELVEVDGSWYLARMPDVERKADASEQVVKMSEFRDRMCACKDSTCAQKVMKDEEEWGSHTADRTHNTRFADDDIAKIGEISQAMAACMQKALSVGATTPPPDPTPAAVDLPKACQEWKAGVDKLDHCPTIAKATVTALRSSYDRTLAAWAKLSGDARASLSGSCDSARDAVNNLLKAAGCN
jgi:hypothetical protein